MDEATDAERGYMMSGAERARRHIRDKGSSALLSAVSVTAVLAGFLSAAGIVWPLLVYLVLIAILVNLILLALALPGRLIEYSMLLLHLRQSLDGPGRPARLLSVRSGGNSSDRLVEVNRCDDPVYSAGFRSLIGPSEPIVIIPSNPRDVGKPHELLYPLFVRGGSRSHIEMNLRALGFKMPSLRFERELPEGAQDPDHVMAIKDIVFIPELLMTFRDLGATLAMPSTWPEHCVDPFLLAARDLVIVGGPDTNFWHAAAFEAVIREFSQPLSSVPLAMRLRDDRGIYGSRSLIVCLSDPAELPRTEEGHIELDERILPTYGMILACRNPFASARGISRWCVFVAGVRSLGTSTGVLALTSMLRQMREDSTRNFFSLVPASRRGVNVPVAAVLYRTSEVEQAVIRRDESIFPRVRRRLPPIGLDPLYSDTYIPTEVEYLSYADGGSRWEVLCRVSAES